MNTRIRIRTDEPQPHIGQLISAYQDGLTTPNESELVERHLLDCEPCRAFYGDLKTAYELVSALPDKTDPTAIPVSVAFPKLRAAQKFKRRRNWFKELIARSK